MAKTEVPRLFAVSPDAIAKIAEIHGRNRSTWVSIDWLTADATGGLCGVEVTAEDLQDDMFCLVGRGDTVDEATKDAYQQYQQHAQKADT